MRRDLIAYRRHQVFLNYPYDQDYRPFAEALSFGVVAAGLLPVSALDLTTPDSLRLDMLVDAIENCDYSAHDLSRSRGEGDDNFARMNMPVEMGMALFYALSTRRSGHRCAFFVPSSSRSHHKYVSDLAGLDPRHYGEDPVTLLVAIYEWLRDIGPGAVVSNQPTVDVINAFEEFSGRCWEVDGADLDGRPSYAEARELMYQVCSARGWWDWRGTRAGIEEFPRIPLRTRARPATPPTGPK
jgi:hypothetical protein